MVENAHEHDKKRRKARNNGLAKFALGLTLAVTMNYAVRNCTEANSMEHKEYDNTIDQIVETAHCGFNSKLHYQAPIERGTPGFEEGYRSFCLTGDEGCPFYVTDGKQHDFCNAYRKTQTGDE